MTKESYKRIMKSEYPTLDEIGQQEVDHFNEEFPNRCGSCINKRVMVLGPLDVELYCYQDGDEIKHWMVCRFKPTRYKMRDKY